MSATKRMNIYQALESEQFLKLMENVELFIMGHFDCDTPDEYAKPVEFIGNDSTQFIWQSRRDGWNHIYLYKTDGTLIKQLTQGDWEVTSIVKNDMKAGILYFTATKESFN